MNPITDFGKGAAYALHGFSLMRRPGARAFVAAPLVINALLFAVLMILGVTYLPNTMDHFMASLPDYLQWLQWLLWPLLFILMVVVGGLCCLLLASLIAAPFAAPLAAAVARERGCAPHGGNLSIRETVTESLGAVGTELRKFGYFMKLAIPLFILSLIPFVQIAAPPLWFLFSGWLLAQEFADYPLGLFGADLTEQRRRIRSRRTLFFGFGVVTLLVTMIPFINMLAYPAAISGMTALVCGEGLAGAGTAANDDKTR
ncbi:MAG: sulfate transporter CysZ [Gammaproteobacteria bacterium]|nr:sulfate transporter CysZ [Gammaproteobacteria bacterium]